MTYKALMTVLTEEHHRRFGTAPTHRAWLWQPWVREFLRGYVPPGRKERRHA
jgi:hypothetical protein